MLTVLFQEFPDLSPPLELRQRFQQSQTLSQLVLTAWQLGLWFARALVEQELEVLRAARPTRLGHLSRLWSPPTK